MSRKTIAVADVIAYANAMLAATPDDWVGERQGIAALLDKVLHATDTYAGFNYQPSEFLPADEQTLDNVLKPDYDGSRRYYYTHHRLANRKVSL